ncbi:hypothetical protein TNCV_2007191 [Trichonephila clavipes]|nr:hypothetical protein TNCV_2007191 [Trichonephila clavipes]
MKSAFAAGGTLNSRTAASSLVSLGEGEERWDASDDPQSILPRNWGPSNCSVTCMVFKATVNGRRTTSPWHDEFCGP